MLSLPDELLLTVLRFLDPHDVLNIRQICSRLYLVSLDRALWTAITLRLSKSLPLPSRDRIRASTLSELELIAVQAVNVEKQWLRPRKNVPRKIKVSLSSQTYPADYLKLFENRFALVVFARPCIVTLWDLDSLQPHKRGEQYRWGTMLGRWVYEDGGAIVAKSCSAQIRESTREIFVSFCLAEQTAYASYVLSIPITGVPTWEHAFRQVTRLEQTLDFDSPLVSTCLNPDSSYLARSRQGPEAIELINLEHGYSRSITATATHRRIGAEESIMFSYWIAMEFCGPYVIAVKPNILQIYLVPANAYDNDTPRQCSTHMETFTLPEKNFRSASLSVLSINTGHATSMSVALCLVDPFDVVLHYVLCMPRDPGTLFSFTAILLGTDTSLAARGVFIGSELALSSRGTRATWIEKSRRSLERRVVAFTAGNEGNTDASEARKMRTSHVYLTSSSDFSEDIIHLDFDDLTGRIVLATRGGELWVLDCSQRLPMERKPLARFCSPNIGNSEA